MDLWDRAPWQLDRHGGGLLAAVARAQWTTLGGLAALLCELRVRRTPRRPSRAPSGNAAPFASDSDKLVWCLAPPLPARGLGWRTGWRADPPPAAPARPATDSSGHAARTEKAVEKLRDACIHRNGDLERNQCDVALAAIEFDLDLTALL